jgi:hypothetical protein
MTAITATANRGPAATTPGLGRRLYHGWLELAGHFGEVQSVLVVCFVYLFVMGPMALLASATRRDLLAKRGFDAATSAWSDSDSVSKPDLERAKRLF